MRWDSASIQPRKVAPFLTVAFSSAPAKGISTSVPAAIAVPATVMLPSSLSYWKVILEDSFATASAKFFITSLFSVLFCAVVMVTVKFVPASITFSKLPEVPPATAPSIFSSLTEEAVQSKEIFALLPLSLYTVMVAVFELAPRPIKPLLPFAVVVTAPLE